MATIKHDGKTYTIYFDTQKELKFVMEEKEEQRFTKLVKDARKVEDIDPSELLTGIYLSQKTNTVVGILNDEIVANCVRFYNERGQ